MENFKKNFDEIYAKNIYPLMSSLEPQRRKEYEKCMFVKYSVIMLTLIPPFIIILLMRAGVRVSILFLIIFIISLLFVFPILALAVAGYDIYKQNLIKNFKRLLKYTCTPEIMSFFDNLKYKDMEIPEELFRESGLFAAFDSIKTDDVFTGKYQDIWFHVEELKLITLNNGLAFKGIVIVFPTNKTINSKTIVATKTDLNKNNAPNARTPYLIIFGFYMLISLFLIMQSIINGESSNIFGFVFILIIMCFVMAYYTIGYKWKSEKYQKIKLEDIGFDKRFAVQSKDQIEARYLVTPAFMERMKDLQTAFGTKDIKCSFFGNRVMFAISSNRDLFEIGDLFTPLTDSKHLHQFIDELDSIYELIDYFKLNEKTGL